MTATHGWGEPLPAPHDLPAERALLGGLMTEPEHLAGLALTLSLEDFYRPEHGALFGLLVQMHVRGEPIELLTVGVRVAAESERFGGAGYVADLPEHCPSTANLSHYAERIRDRARRRRLAEIAQGAARDAIDDNCDPSDIVARLLSLSADCADSAAGGWQEPMPLGEVTLPPFPTRALPDKLCNYVEALAEYTQTPVDSPAMLILPVLATALQGKLCVRDRWVEPLCVWAAVVLPPGARKSPVHAAIFEPVTAWEQDAYNRDAAEQRKRAGQRAELVTERSRLEKERNKLNRAVEQGKGKGKAEPAELEATGKALEAIEEQLEATGKELEALGQDRPPTRLLTSDITPEALARLLSEQGGRLTVASPEGGELFELAGGRYSDGRANYEVLLKGWSGESVTVDRIGRESLRIPRAVLSLGLAIQPDVLQSLSNGRAGFKGRGFLGRWLFAMPEAGIGYRRSDAEAVPEYIERAYASLVRSLLEVDGQRDDSGTWKPREIRVSPEGSRAFSAFCDEIEALQRPGQQLAEITDWASKLAGSVLRVAALLHAAGRPSVDPASSLISADEIDRAVTIGRYLIPHALATHGLAGAESPTLAGAKRVLRWLAGRRLFTARDCFNTLRRSFGDKMENMWPALELLEAAHYLRRVPDQPVARGRKPSPTFLVSPWVVAAESTQSAEIETLSGSSSERGRVRGSRP